MVPHVEPAATVNSYVELALVTLKGVVPIVDSNRGSRNSYGS